MRKDWDISVPSGERLSRQLEADICDSVGD